jgi:hypothetical protein
MVIGTGTARVWCHDLHVWRFVLTRYIPALSMLSALWEIAQLPLYTLWWEARPISVAYAVFHCTLGDVLIGVGALLAALIVTRSGTLRDWHWILVGTVTVTISLSYTAFSEWINTTVRSGWTYSEWMPVTPFVPIGVSPFLQWVVVPLAALAFFRRVA